MPPPLRKTLPEVLIAEPIDPAPLAWLGRRARMNNATGADRADMLDALARIDALLVRTYTLVDRQLLDHAPTLRVVARAGAGLDNIDLEACRERGVRVVHTPDANTAAVVEYVTQTMLTALRPIATLDRPLPPPAWHTLRQSAVSPRSCVGTRLGIVGLGRIGSRVAAVAGALGMEAVYHDIIEIEDRRRHGARPVPLDELAQTSGVVTLHVDGRAANRGLVGEGLFSRLRGDVVLINAARGFILDPRAAADFATANPGARLILDVHDPEPLSADSPLLGLENVTLTPHIGAGTREAKERMSWVVRDLMRVLDGERPHHAAV